MGLLRSGNERRELQYGLAQHQAQGDVASQVGDVEQALEYAFRLTAGVDGGVILLPYHYTCKVLCVSLIDNPFHLIGGYGRAADRLLAHKAIGSVGCDISVYQVLYRIQIVDERIRTACGDEYPDALGLGNLNVGWNASRS